MTEISVTSFLAFFILSVVGAYWHYRKVRKTGRHDGTLIDYLLADHPQRSAYVWMALALSSWTAATSGVADFINPELVWTLLTQGKLHIPSISIMVVAVQSGYQFDSWLNKGGNE